MSPPSQRQGSLILASLLLTSQVFGTGPRYCSPILAFLYSLVLDSWHPFALYEYIFNCRHCSLSSSMHCICKVLILQEQDNTWSFYKLNLDQVSHVDFLSSTNIYKGIYKNNKQNQVLFDEGMKLLCEIVYMK